MNSDMDPRTRIKIIDNLGRHKVPVYLITLSKANFEYLCADCPETGHLRGYAVNGTSFCIFNNIHGKMEDSFKRSAMDEVYSTHIGIPMPQITEKSINEIDKLFQFVGPEFEAAINQHGIMPMIDYASKNNILGYAIMQVEKKELSNKLI